jgi:hypothetical protein
MFGAASCDVLDPYEPGTSGSSTGSRRHDTEATQPDSRKISADGHVRMLSQNGATVWGFETDGLARYEFMALPQAYQHDGLRVHVEAIVDNSSAAHGYGKRIKLSDIDAIRVPALPTTPSTSVPLN